MLSAFHGRGNWRLLAMAAGSAAILAVPLPMAATPRTR